MTRSRLKTARQGLADEPSPKNYLALAHEHARLGEMTDVQRVCQEALEIFPGHPELQRLADRARALLLEDRTRELVRELRQAPRPALYRELCELYLKSGRIERAEETAVEWFTSSGDGNAVLLQAQARLERFRADKRREDGRVASELLDTAEKLLERDERPLRMRLELMCAVGAWRDARRVVGQLLELAPGDPVLEARFRTLASIADNARSFDAALRESERTGKLTLDEPPRAAVAAPTRSIRPMLKELADEQGVQAALFERGATALVQGPKGATAERTARAVREIVQKTRTTSRRLGLGSPLEVELEGEFGSVLIAPGELGAAALWCGHAEVPERLRARVRELTGAGAEALEEDES
jgi:tetratricopeptide (TPR) repeat protein